MLIIVVCDVGTNYETCINQDLQCDGSIRKVPRIDCSHKSADSDSSDR